MKGQSHTYCDLYWPTRSKTGKETPLQFDLLVKLVFERTRENECMTIEPTRGYKSCIPIPRDKDQRKHDHNAFSLVEKKTPIIGHKVRRQN